MSKECYNTMVPIIPNFQPMNINNLKDVHKWKIKDTDMVVECYSPLALTPAKITAAEDNIVEVFISSPTAGKWYESWNLSHTILGFQQGLYIPILDKE